jgi:hypothetical protein
MIFKLNLNLKFKFASSSQKRFAALRFGPEEYLGATRDVWVSKIHKTLNRP